MIAISGELPGLPAGPWWEAEERMRHVKGHEVEILEGGPPQGGGGPANGECRCIR